MIPSSISPQVKSYAEKRIFTLFQRHKQTKDWIILHSLGIESHFNRVYGEIDFLVLAPQYGIFAIEVKGGGVKRVSGSWIFTNRYDANFIAKISPVEQAKQGIFNVKAFLKQQAREFKGDNVLFGFGLMFPDVNFTNDDPDISQDHVYDITYKDDVFLYIKNLSHYYQKTLYAQYVDYVLPSKEQVQKIAKLLRPDFDIAVSIESKKINAEEEIVRLTEEQYRCIDGLESNERCFITGYAGAGKTILALKHLKNEILKEDNIAYFCDNPLLADQVKNSVKTDLPNLTLPLIQSFKAWMIDYYLLHYASPQVEPYSDSFVLHELPLIVYDLLQKFPLEFNEIIIDQAHELLSEEYLLVFDQLLKHGLKKGEWFIFGDFDVHTAFDKSTGIAQARKRLDDYGPNYMFFRLTENCRNTPPIIDAANRIAGIKSSRMSLYQEHHHPVEFKTYTDDIDLIEKLEKLIRELTKFKTIGPEDITIIDLDSVNSMVKKRRDTKSLSSTIMPISYYSPENFNGLENSMIILLHVKSYQQRFVLYKLFTRARTALFVFETKQASFERKKIG
jgi:hypothetical protein